MELPWFASKDAFILLPHNRMRVQWHVIPQHERNCLKLIYIPLPWGQLPPISQVRSTKSWVETGVVIGGGFKPNKHSIFLFVPCQPQMPLSTLHSSCIRILWWITSAWHCSPDREGSNHRVLRLCIPIYSKVQTRLQAKHPKSEGWQPEFQGETILEMWQSRNWGGLSHWVCRRARRGNWRRSMECCTIGSAGLRACGTKHTHIQSKSCGNLTVCCGKLPFIDDLPV